MRCYKGTSVNAAEDTASETTIIPTTHLPRRDDDQQNQQDSESDSEQDNDVVVSVRPQDTDNNQATVDANAQPAITAVEAVTPDADASAAPPAGAAAEPATAAAGEPDPTADRVDLIPTTTEPPVATTRSPVFSDRKQLA